MLTWQKRKASIDMLSHRFAGVSAFWCHQVNISLYHCKQYTNKYEWWT